MYVASQKRKENVAEYLLYMWQIEDLIRANGLDLSKIEERIVSPSGLSDEQRREMLGWYESLIDMMRREGVEAKGHLQINQNMVGQLADLHQRLLADPKFQDYHAEFYKTLPYIVELRSRAGEEKAGEIETCFNALYGWLLLRLKGQEISPETQQAMAQIARFVALLTRDFHLDEQEKLFKRDE